MQDQIALPAQFMGIDVDKALAAASSAYNGISRKLVILAALSKEFIGVQAQHLLELANLEASLPELVTQTLKSWWRVWEHNVPGPIRWIVYGVILGLTAYTLLNIAGFVATGIRRRSLAAAIQSRIGVVSKGTIFAALQRLGVLATPLNSAVSGAVVALVFKGLKDMLRSKEGAHEL